MATQLSRSRTACAARPLPTVQPRSIRAVVVRAEPETARSLSFTPSTQSAEGFVEKDTAGQSNMYPVYTRPFEAGSANDTVNQDGFNNGLAVGASVVALGLIGAGLTVLVNTTAPAPADTEDYTKYLSLTQYSSKFAAELAPSAPPVETVVATEL